MNDAEIVLSHLSHGDVPGGRRTVSDRVLTYALSPRSFRATPVLLPQRIIPGEKIPGSEGRAGRQITPGQRKAYTDL